MLALVGLALGGLLFAGGMVAIFSGGAAAGNRRTAARDETPGSGADAAEQSAQPMATGAQSAGAVVPESGPGTFTMATGTSSRVGSGQLLRYRVAVENGTGQDAEEFATWVDKVLADPRGWTAGHRWAFVRVSAEPVDFVVKLATPHTVDQICNRYGIDTDGEASCRGAENVVINLRRWMLGIPAYEGDVDMYRHLVVNHEVGHFLGHSHVTCPGKGRPAPVMQTQMYGLNGCRINAWPYPNGRYVD